MWCDGKIAFDSGTITEKNPPRPVHVDLAGVKELVAKILPAKAAADNGQAKN